MKKQWLQMSITERYTKASNIRLTRLNDKCPRMYIFTVFLSYSVAKNRNPRYLVKFCRSLL